MASLSPLATSLSAPDKPHPPAPRLCQGGFPSCPSAPAMPGLHPAHPHPVTSSVCHWEDVINSPPAPGPCLPPPSSRSLQLEMTRVHTCACHSGGQCLLCDRTDAPKQCRVGPARCCAAGVCTGKSHDARLWIELVFMALRGPGS